MRSAFLVKVLIASCLIPRATLGESASTPESPNLELLEFLADFGELDDNGFELILHHGLQDQKDEKGEKDNKVSTLDNSKSHPGDSKEKHLDRADQQQESGNED